MQCLSDAHAFDYIVLRINPDLTSCKELAMVMDISLDTNHSSCNASYILSLLYMHVWDNKSASTIAVHGYTCYTYSYKVCIKSKQTSI